MWLGLTAFMMAIALIAISTYWLLRLHKAYFDLSEEILKFPEIDTELSICNDEWNWMSYEKGEAERNSSLLPGSEEPMAGKGITSLQTGGLLAEEELFPEIGETRSRFEEKTGTDTREAERRKADEGVKWAGEVCQERNQLSEEEGRQAEKASPETSLTSDGSSVPSKGGEELMDPLVRAEVVIGEATKQLLVENNFVLSQAAIKIRNITAEIQQLTAEIIVDKVIIQGVLHKQIFFVGEDNIVHHQSEDIPFSTFVDIFGAEPGMNAQVHPTIETILFNLITPTLLHQKVVMEFFVKVTESTQLNVLEGMGPLVRIDQVIGEGTKQELVESTVTLNIATQKIDDITAEIRDLTIEVIEDKVIIQGVLHKQIFLVGLDNIEYHQAVEIEFSTFLDIPGAEPGMDVVVEPTIEFIHFELLDANTELEKVVLEFFVKVTESVQINVALGPGALLKLDTVIGEQTTQLLIENTVILNQNAIKVREIIAKVENLMAEVIEDKVIIQGIIHKQIFFINENNLEIHQSENLPFSTFVDIPGVAQGMDVRIKPRIETILFELLDPVTLRQKVVVELFVKVTETQQLEVQIAAPYGPYYF